MCVYTIHKYHNSHPRLIHIWVFPPTFTKHIRIFNMCVYTIHKYHNSYPRLIHIWVLPPIFTNKHVYILCVCRIWQLIPSPHSHTSPPANIYKTHLVYILRVYRSQQLIPSPHSYILPSIFTKHTRVYSCVCTSHTHVYTHHTHMWCVKLCIIQIWVLPPIFTKHTGVYPCVSTSHTQVRRQTLQHLYMSPPVNIYRKHTNRLYVYIHHTHKRDESHFATFIYESSHKYSQNTSVYILRVHTSHARTWWVTLVTSMFESSHKYSPNTYVFVIRVNTYSHAPMW